MPWPPPSTLPDTPFPSRPLAAVAAVAEALLSPGYWALDRLLALLVPTTAQRARWRRHRAGRCLAAGSRALLAPALLLALLLALPPALLGLLLWLPAQAKRRPFVHQYVVTTAAAEPWDPRRARGFTFLTANVCLLPSGLARFSNLGRTRRRAEVIGRILAAGAPAEPSGHRRGLLEPRRGRGYGGTAGGWASGGSGQHDGQPNADDQLNVDDQPNTDGQLNTDDQLNVDDQPNIDGQLNTDDQLNVDDQPNIDGQPNAHDQLNVDDQPNIDGQPNAHDQLNVDDQPNIDGQPNADDQLNLPTTNPAPGAAPCPASSPGPERPIPLADPMPPVLSARIPPDTDFVCLQEVFDGAAAAALRRQLGRRFPHVLWGVGPGGLRCGRLRALGSGLLLGSRFPLLAARFRPFPNAAREDALANKGLLVAQVLLGMGRGRRVVGYLGCTHLQAPAADATIRDQQLSLVLRWLREFRRDQDRPGDLVAFDVLCGDLNLDNCSRGGDRGHGGTRGTECRTRRDMGEGQGDSGGHGTLLNYLKIYEEPVSTPEEMRRGGSPCLCH
uniref:sphingomyelin phosphodiesterase n=1 Tax=Geospiza parvula TaxID=87175 RepID=A0A8U8B136_GEOPR